VNKVFSEDYRVCSLQRANSLNQKTH